MTEPNAFEILLVEDNSRDAELTIRALQKRQLAHHVVWVKDGAEALDYLFGTDAEAGHGVPHQPRLILLDLKLPRVDGLEVLRRLRADARTRLIPVVVLTSSREDQDIVQSYRLGVNSYIVKPVEFDQFAAAVGDLGRYWVRWNQPPKLTPPTQTGGPQDG